MASLLLWAAVGFSLSPMHLHVHDTAVRRPALLMSEAADTPPNEDEGFSFMAPPPGYECEDDEECVLPDEDEDGSDEADAASAAPTAPAPEPPTAPPPNGFEWGGTY